MAGAGEEEAEYESDPEEAKLSLTMRRREASDDEEDGGGDESERREKLQRRTDSRVGICPGGESDGQGAAAEYDDEESEGEDEDEEVVVEDEEEEVEEVEEEEYEERVGEDGVGGSGEVEPVGMAAREAANELDGERGRSVGESTDLQDLSQVEEEKKENEPFAVPTAGAFYMHDDRFRDNAGGRHRRTLGGRKLWESRDDRKWGHDKFEEMTLQEQHYEEGRRTSRSNYRGRGKNRGGDRGYQRGNRSKAYYNNQNHAPKTVRGRGPRRYEPSPNNSEAPPTQNRQSGKSVEKTSYASSGRVPASTLNVEPDPVSARKHVFASSLSSASPPFYPSGSSNKEIPLTQKRDVQAGTINRNLRHSVMDDSFMSQSNAMVRGKDIADSIAMDKLYIDDSNSPVAGKPSTNYQQLPPSGSSLINTTQSSHSRSQGRILPPTGQMNFQPTMPHNQANRVSPPIQLNTVQRSPLQSRVQPSSQASAQQLGQRPGSGSQASSPPKAVPSITSFEPEELDSPPESNKSKTALVGKGKGSVQGSGRGSFLYGGAQVVGAPGNMGGGHGDQNFSPTPAFLPVMQFGGQHSGGMGVPAVGMAFPGYVAQPHGLGNSEMTWLPVLAGAGALGATYCSPYITVDGAHNTRPSGQTSSSGSSSKENNSNKPTNEWKPSQRSEPASDEFGQRQNNPRRYSKMSFGQ